LTCSSVRPVLDQQVEVAVDAAADRILDREHAVGRRVGVHGREDVLERLARHEFRVGAHQTRRRLAERSGFSLIGKTHSGSSHRYNKRAIISVVG
jgi:hypothetical protein